MSTSYPHQIDARNYVATESEDEYGEAQATTAFNREFAISDVEPTLVPKRTPHSPCGGEFHTNITDEQWDSSLAINAVATPDLTAFLFKYYFGGKAGYAATGSADPWLHTYKFLQPPDYQHDSFSLVQRYKGRSEFYRYRGGLVDDWKMGASIDGDKRFKHGGTIRFAGQRESVTIASPPACVPEDAFRITSTVFSMGIFGGDPFTGAIRPRSYEIGANNSLVNDDEVDRDGLYVAGRDRGNRGDACRLKVSVLGDRGDQFDQAFNEGDFIYLNAVSTPAPNRVMTIYGPKLQIMSLTRGYSTSAAISTHELDLLAFLDPTSPTTESRSPFWATVQTGTASY